MQRCSLIMTNSIFSSKLLILNVTKSISLLILTGFHSVFVRDKELLEESKNNHSARFKLDGNFYYNPTLTNHFELSASSSILRYDTPSEINTDDRDELNIVVYLAHRFDNLKNFRVVNSVDLNLYHTVYIFADKSANNNWNRVLRFTSSNIFTPIEA